MSITNLTIIIFISQILFIGLRTWNILAISKDNVIGAILSGAMVHMVWLVSVSIGVTSATELIQDWNTNYIPVIVASTVGGAIGTMISLRKQVIIDYVEKMKTKRNK